MYWYAMCTLLASHVAVLGDVIVGNCVASPANVLVCYVHTVESLFQVLSSLEAIVCAR
jgi:hypothetical protein